MKNNFHHRQTFTPEQKKELAQYLIVAQKLNNGLTPKQTRKLAFSYGKVNAIKMPIQLLKNELDGEDWFAAFLKWNANLSIRKPERKSQARAAAVNHPVIDNLYDDYQDLLTKYKFLSSELFNTDETNNPTVLDEVDRYCLTNLNRNFFLAGS